LSNLDICFPEKDEKWKKDIIRNSYISLCLTLFEFFCLPKINERNISKYASHCGFLSNEEITDNSNSRFFLSAHFSNWEFLAYLFPLIFGSTLNIIVKTQSNIILDKKINEFREATGNKIIPMEVSLREVYKKISSNEIICFLIDQAAHSEYSVYTGFFGKNVATFSGPAKLALKYRPKLVFSYAVRGEKFKLNFYTEKIKYDDIQGLNDNNIIKLTQRIQDKLEEIVRKYPEHWLWFHKRFKYVKN